MLPSLWCIVSGMGKVGSFDSIIDGWENGFSPWTHHGFLIALSIFFDNFKIWGRAVNNKDGLWRKLHVLQNFLTSERTWSRKPSWSMEELGSQWFLELGFGERPRENTCPCIEGIPCQTRYQTSFKRSLKVASKQPQSERVSMLAKVYQHMPSWLESVRHVC